jgi:hypothetical protein
MALYVIVNNYRTNYDDYREVYLLGIQVDMRSCGFYLPLHHRPFA